jgi:internalin A
MFLNKLKRLRNLDSVLVQGSKVTADGVGHLSEIEKLESLTLCGNAIGVGGFAHLGKLTRLRYLNLESTHCTDHDVALLIPLANLTDLDLGYNPGVTDSGLRHLIGLRKLAGLRLYETKVTDDGVAELKKALPRLSVGK